MFELTVRCTREPEKHAKKLRLRGVEKEWAEMLAGLLDGSSKFYIYKPGPDSPIGKCATCGGTVTCTVEEVSDGKDAQPKS